MIAPEVPPDFVEDYTHVGYTSDAASRTPGSTNCRGLAVGRNRNTGAEGARSMWWGYQKAWFGANNPGW